MPVPHYLDWYRCGVGTRKPVDDHSTISVGADVTAALAAASAAYDVSGGSAIQRVRFNAGVWDQISVSVSGVELYGEPGAICRPSATTGLGSFNVQGGSGGLAAPIEVTAGVRNSYTITAASSLAAGVYWLSTHNSYTGTAGTTNANASNAKRNGFGQMVEVTTPGTTPTITRALGDTVDGLRADLIAPVYDVGITGNWAVESSAGRPTSVTPNQQAPTSPVNAYHSVNFKWAVRCYVDGVDLMGHRRAGVNFDKAFQCEAVNLTIHDPFGTGDGGTGYGLNIGSQSTNCLGKNVTVDGHRHSFLWNGCSANAIVGCSDTNPRHPNYPNGGPPQGSHHLYSTSNLIEDCDLSFVSAWDTGEPGAGHVIHDTRITPGLLKLDQGVSDYRILGVTVTGTHADLQARTMPSLYDYWASDGIWDTRAARAWLYNTGEVPAGGDVFADQGYGPGVWAADVDASADIEAGPALPYKLTDQQYSATPPIGGSMNVTHTEAHNADRTKTVPLSAHANRQAVLVVSTQGPSNNNPPLGAMTGWTEIEKRLGQGFIPACSVWTRNIGTGELDFDIPFGHDGGGWSLTVGTGFDLANVQATIAEVFSTSASIGSAFTGLAITAIASSGQKTVDMPAGWNPLPTEEPWFSEPQTAYLIDPTGPANWTVQGAADNLCSISVTVPELSIPINASFQSTAVTNGAVVGSGVGTDVGSTDNNGITTQSGDPILFTRTWDLDVTPTELDVSVRVVPQNGIPATHGYEITVEVLDDGGAVIGGPVVLGNIIGGESATVLTGTVSL